MYIISHTEEFYHTRLFFEKFTIPMPGINCKLLNTMLLSLPKKYKTQITENLKINILEEKFI